MTVTVFLTILTACAVATSLLTEGLKNFLDGIDARYASNVLVLFVSFIVGCGATLVYYINYQVPFTALNAVYLVLMGVANWLGATLGYDKVRQTIAQIAGEDK